MLTKITLENFKLFKSVTIEPALVTLLIGPNGTGKSSIIQALMVLKQTQLSSTLLGKLLFEGTVVKLGSFQEGVHGHRNDLTLTLHLEAAINGGVAGFKSSYDRQGNPMHPVIINQSRMQELFRNIRFVRPIRGFDEATYTIREQAADLIQLQRPDARASNVVTVLLHASPALQRRVDALAREITRRGIVARNAPQHQAFLAAPDGDELTNIVHEGFGHNQLAELLLQLAEAEEDSLLCIEEPEIHLHPGAQAKLGRVLGREAKAHQIQLLMTTHSEHILMSFLTQVAKKELRPEDLAVYYFKRKNGYAEAERLKVTEKGTIEGGMKGFFEVELAELDEYMKARLGQAQG